MEGVCSPARRTNRGTAMIRYCCDLCHRTLQEHEQRYVVRMEVYPGSEEIHPEHLEEDRDHLAELNELLEGIDEQLDEPPDCHQFRYDLCARCYRRFVRNPLGREASVSFKISQN